VLVAEVRPAGLIERAGIKAGDCITAVNGERIYTAQDLTRQIQRLSRAEGTAQKIEAVFAIVRDRREMEVKAEIGGR
jgi:S1-C subfamily serine protease